jgi:hypothetical protein
MSTRAIEVSIQAVSPELGVHFSSTANLGSALPAQAGGPASAGAAAAGAASSAQETAVGIVIESTSSGRINAAIDQNLRNVIRNLPIDHARDQTTPSQRPPPKNKIRANQGFRRKSVVFRASHCIAA